MDNFLYVNWDNYRNSFLDTLNTLRSLDQDEYSDATLACEGKFYKVHKLVLSSCSDYFKEIFRNTPCKNPVIVLKDVRCEDLEFLLDYMYTGSAHIKQSQMMPLIKAAECLRIKGLAIPDYKEVNEAMQPKRKRKKPNGSLPKKSEFHMSPSEKMNPNITTPVHMSLSEKMNPNITTPVENLPDLTDILSHNEEIPYMMPTDQCNRTIETLQPQMLVDESSAMKLEDVHLKQEDATVKNEAQWQLIPEHPSLPENVKYNDGEQHVLPLANMHPVAPDQRFYMTIPSTSHSTPDHETIHPTPIGQLTMETVPTTQHNFMQLIQKTDSTSTRKNRKKKVDHECRICGKMVGTGYKMQDHIRSHTGEKPYKCPHCSFRCGYKYNAIKHMMRRHGDDSRSVIVDRME